MKRLLLLFLLAAAQIVSAERLTPLFTSPLLSGTVINEVGISLSLQDNSDDDQYYIINRTGSDGTIQVQTIQANTQGLYVFFDYTVHPYNTYTYFVDAVLNDGSTQTNVSSITVNTTDRNPLEYPTFEGYDGISLTETAFIFGYNNITEGATTHIYRATEKIGPYTLIGTVHGIRGLYTDRNLNPGTTYYYTLKSEYNGNYSAFAGIPQITTFENFQLPDFSAVALPDTTVQITLHDRGLSEKYYDLIRENLTDGNGDFITIFTLPDSGSTVVFFDETVEAGKNYRYVLGAMFENNGGTVAIAEVSTPGGLLTPQFSFSAPPPDMPCGREIALVYDNPNDIASTEIWRSTNYYSGYTLVGVTGNESFYMDTTVASHATYYYKLRAAHEGVASGFSSPSIALTSGSDFYPPTLSANLTADNTVEFSLVDNTYQEAFYEVYAFDLTTQLLTDFSLGIISPDSGVVHTYVHENVIPGHEYHYGVSATLKCDGYPVISEFSVSITIPNPLAIQSVIVIDPDTDQPLMTLENGSVLDNSGYNLMAVVNDSVQSVVFMLDGKRYVDNTAPFALFPETKGDFKKGHLRGGSHELIITAFAEKNGKGARGNETSLVFIVNPEQKKSLVNLYPNPVTSHSVLEVAGLPNEILKLDLHDQYGSFIKTIYTGHLNSHGSMMYPFTLKDLRKGLYLLNVTTTSKKETIRFSVD